MRIAVCSKLFAAVHRKREGVDGEGVSSTSEPWWGDRVVGYMLSPLLPNSLSLLCSQKCVSPATGTFVS